MTLHWLVPGPLDQRTGGYLYDARMVAGLRAGGEGVQVHELDGEFPGPATDSARSLDRALQEVPDGAVVVADGLALGSFPEVAEAHVPRVSLVALVHHPLGDETGLTQERRRRLLALETRTLGVVRGVIVTSPTTAHRVAQLGVPAAAVRAVVPGTAPAPPSRGPGEGAPVRLLSVGTVAPRKGHDVLVRALARLSHLPWRCHVAGSLTRDPGWADRVRHLADELSVADRVDFLGELDRDALEAQYGAASLFVLPSHYEGYGMALTEALARGLPVISTTGGAIPGTVPADTGVLVEPGDEGALASVLEELLNDGSRREALAAAARAHAGSLPDWPAQVDAFSVALEELVARRGAGVREPARG